MHLPFGYILKADFHGGLLPFMGLLLILIILIFLTHHRRVVTQGTISRPGYLLITSFRILISLILLILLFNPDIELERTQILPKRIALLVDRSMSMTKAWNGTESELAEAVERYIQSAEDLYDLEIWSMDGEKISKDDIQFEQEYTAFDWFPGIAGSDEERYQAVLLISDGHLNQGRSPLDLKWTSTLPILPVLPLNPLTNQSISLVDLNYTLPKQEGEPVMLNMKIQHEGLIGDEIAVTIRDAKGEELGKTLKRMDQMLVGTSIPIILPFGKRHSLQVEILSEASGLKVQKSMMIEPKDQRMRIMLASERPDLQFKFLAQSFPDSLYLMKTLLGEPMKTAASGIFDGDAVDLLILNEPGPRLMELLSQRSLRAYLEAEKPVVVFYSGVEAMNKDWLALLKVEQKAVNWKGEFPVAWEQEALDHPLYLGAMGAGFESLSTERFPPVKRNAYMIHDDGSHLLSVQAGEISGSVLSLSSSGSTAYFNGASMWKWFFQPETKASFEPFWAYLLEYLFSQADFRPVVLNLNSQNGETGDYIPVNVEVKDVNGARVFSEVNVWQEDAGGEKIPLNVERRETGLYQTQLSTRNAGSFHIVAEAYRFGELWGRDTSRIELMTFNEEGQSEGVDRVFLQRLAEHSDGGRIISTTDNPPIFPEKSFVRKSSTQFKGLRSAVVFYLLILLMLLEWTIRRRNGLL